MARVQQVRLPTLAAAIEPPGLFCTNLGNVSVFGVLPTVEHESPQRMLCAALRRRSTASLAQPCTGMQNHLDYALCLQLTSSFFGDANSPQVPDPHQE